MMNKPLILLPLTFVALVGAWVALRPYNAVDEIEQAYRLLRGDRALLEWSGGQPDATHVRTTATSAGRVYRFEVSRGESSCQVEVQFTGEPPVPARPEIIRRQGDCEPQRLGHLDRAR